MKAGGAGRGDSPGFGRPAARQRIEANLSTLPASLASWPCTQDIARYQAGDTASMCEACRTIGEL
ncbi:hypothetical protein AB0M95_40420 [Sphaerisporangium sp. NPDC051017]|uniref:hypothetical protein n=1 Tax=Sphaerisporangium sp. NPDC051017 TaxID=3154636 RepID=UPI003435D317